MAVFIRSCNRNIIDAPCCSSSFTKLWKTNSTFHAISLNLQPQIRSIHQTDHAKPYLDPYGRLKRKYPRESMRHWWKTPERIGPETTPLEEGPDFTFKDGRPTPLSSKRQYEDRLHEINLATKIVQYLEEMKDAEIIKEKSDNEKKSEREAYLAAKPKQKGSNWQFSSSSADQKMS